MSEEGSTYPEFRHALVARYDHFRLDQVWMRHHSTAEREFSYELAFEIDASSEFTLGTSPLSAGEYREIHAGEVPSAAEIVHVVTRWLRPYRPPPESDVVWIACYRRRIGPPDGEHGATPGEWYMDPHFRRPDKPMIDLHEAVPFVEVSLRELEKAETEGHGASV